MKKIVGFHVENKVYAVFIRGKMENTSFYTFDTIEELFQNMDKDSMFITGISSEKTVFICEFFPKVCEAELTELVEMKMKYWIKEKMRTKFQLLREEKEKVWMLIVGIPENKIKPIEDLLKGKNYILDVPAVAFFNILELNGKIEDGIFVLSTEEFFHIIRIKNNDLKFIKTFNKDSWVSLEWIEHHIQKMERSSEAKIKGVAGKLCKNYPDLCILNLSKIFGREIREEECYIIPAAYALRGYYD